MYTRPDYFFLIILAVLFCSCSASVGDRYEKKTEKDKEEKGERTITETFDMKPYVTKFEFKSDSINIDNTKPEIWYGYESDEFDNSISDTNYTRQDAGYRVQVMVTDNQEEADSLRSEIYFKLKEKSIYIDFDPPLYRIKVGDFTNISDARNLNFKLTQLGYSQSRVISDSVYVK